MAQDVSADHERERERAWRLREEPRLRGAACELYKKHPVSGTQTRLLSLHSGKHVDPIRCTLMTASGNSTPYDALSYAWGPDYPPAAIEVDSYTLPVTLNLERALRRLRREGSARTLWIDAICINQSDLAERGHQCRMMSQIYGEAESVVVWLGELKAPRSRLPHDVRCKCNPKVWNQYGVRSVLNAKGPQEPLERPEAAGQDSAVPDPGAEETRLQTWQMCLRDWQTTLKSWTPESDDVPAKFPSYEAELAYFKFIQCGKGE